MSINSNFYNQLQTKPKAISFDWDGTLCDTRPAVVKAINFVLKKYNLDNWEITKSKRDKNKSFKENFPNFFNDSYEQAYIEYLDYYEKECLDNVKIIDGSDVFLKKLINSGIFIYIISNKEKSLLMKEAMIHFNDISFKNILGNGDAIENKPSPAPLIKAFYELSIPINCDNFWHIGDTNQDYDSAVKANVLPIMIVKGKLKEKTNFEFDGFHDLIKNISWL
ncbi:MAG: Phosphoglycolate phosphatase [Alphaproteobacteria bacterium ADurb.Bin438]|nr:MAG: Phosphoglycolate phosphatase [Alphaproteobacteria bacterium ADurb.Bin438]